MPKRSVPPAALAMAFLLLAILIALLIWTRSRPTPTPTSQPVPRTNRLVMPETVQTSVTVFPPVTTSPAPAIKTNVVITVPPITQPTITNIPITPVPLPPQLEPPPFVPHAASNGFEVQWALATAGFSPGSIDGLIGTQTRAALRAFQEKHGRAPLGELDTATRELLSLRESPLTVYRIQSNDLLRLQPLPASWLGKSQQSRLDYENILELLGEISWSHPNWIRRLNPQVLWTNLQAGDAVFLPVTRKPVLRSKVAGVRIHLAQRILQATNDLGEILLHFPCSIAQRVEKRPLGQLSVVAIAPNPNYLFDPANFPESAEAVSIRKKLILPPGPNNPVGTAWISLDRPGYGIHGTPRPEDVGRTESHGCFRLANWNAEFLLSVIRIGTPVHVLP